MQQSSCINNQSAGLRIDPASTRHYACKKTNYPMSRISRRSFMRGAAGTSALVMLGGCTAKNPAVSAPIASTGASPAAKPKRIIHMVSDGMSAGVLTLAERYSQQYRGSQTNWRKLMTAPSGEHHQGLMDMASASSVVTDSSAASSSWGCGHRIVNGYVNVAPDGTPLEPILVTAMKHGWVGGLVTTATVTHATPAGFLAQSDKRDDEEGIATQYLERAIQVYLGGGYRFFDPALRSDKKDLLSGFREKGYAVLRSRDELLSQKGDKPLFGTFSESHVPYTVDHLNDAALLRSVPTLAEMTTAALTRLEHTGQGFLLQVEGAKIDHAAHVNDAPGLVRDQIAFDDAIGVALRFQAEHPDTLVVVTTDHGNSNPGLFGQGDGYGDSDKLFSKVGRMSRSYSAISGDWYADMTIGELTSLIHGGTGIELSASEAGLVLDAIRSHGPNPYTYQNAAIPTLASILANHTAVSWGGTSHTGDYVTLTAQGPGASSLPSLLINTDLNAFYRKCMARA